MNIFVGNIAKEVTDKELLDLFTKYGKVSSAKVIKDLFSGESKGFGFIEMPSNNEAKLAIQELNTVELSGKRLTVNEARPRNERGGNNRGFGNRNRW